MTHLRWLVIVILAMACGRVLAGPAAASSKLFGGLPLELAFKQVRGSGTLTFATFEDPNCPYCRQMAKDTADMGDVTIYTFIYPVLSEDSKRIAKVIWCAPNRTKAWKTWMTSGKLPRASACNTDGIDEIVALGKTMKIRSVPTVFLANGDRMSGAKSRMELEMALISPKVRSFQASLK